MTPEESQIWIRFCLEIQKACPWANIITTDDDSSLFEELFGGSNPLDL